MRIANAPIALLGVAALMLLAVACSDSEAADTPTTGPSQVAPAAPGAASAGGTTIEPSAPPPSAPPQVAISAPSAPIAIPEPVRAISGAGASAGAFPASALLQVGGSQSGIWVTGQGTLSLEPDLALVNIGVETQAATVAQARNEAANAMAAIVAAVKARGLVDRDIQTRSFNIFPQYEFPEVFEDGRRVRRQVLVGYTVSNSASIKVRDLDSVGPIIDDVANAGGDATRINGVSFTVEDPKSFMTELRELAVQDALDKAQHLATLTGVGVGRLVLITESGGGIPRVQDFASAERGFALAAAAPTSISGGELELRLNVQAVFEIQ